MLDVWERLQNRQSYDSWVAVETPAQRHRNQFPLGKSETCSEGSIPDCKSSYNKAALEKHEVQPQPLLCYRLLEDPVDFQHPESPSRRGEKACNLHLMGQRHKVCVHSCMQLKADRRRHNIGGCWEQNWKTTVLFWVMFVVAVFVVDCFVSETLSHSVIQGNPVTLCSSRCHETECGLLVSTA